MSSALDPNVWMVGQYGEPEAPTLVGRWEFVGIFSTCEKAEAACVTDDYFVMEAELDVALPQESQEQDGRGYYPRLEGYRA